MVRALAHRNYRLFFAGQGVPASWCSSRRATPSSRPSCARRVERGILPEIAAGLSDAATLRDESER
jgi:hypothetical protein